MNAGYSGQWWRLVKELLHEQCACAFKSTELDMHPVISVTHPSLQTQALRHSIDIGSESDPLNLALNVNSITWHDYSIGSCSSSRGDSFNADSRLDSQLYQALIPSPLVAETSMNSNLGFTRSALALAASTLKLT